MAENDRVINYRNPEGGMVNTTNKPVFITNNSLMREIYRKVQLVARSDVPVMITGESGTGKEVIARMIHALSKRNDNLIVAINCGAIPRDLIESELFGHDKGAFTGAVEKKDGCFKTADKGTLFFDEIGEISPEIQVKLLRAVELNTFRPVGSSREEEVDVRLIAATNKNLLNAISDGEFREDLFYRLSVIEINIPPLRERKDDIPVLTDYFMKVFATKYERQSITISEDCMNKMIDYDWPGNVRELRNVIERFFVICPEPTVTPEYLPGKISKCEGNPIHTVDGHIMIPVGTTIEEAEKRLIFQTLDSVGNNKSEAARILGFSRKTLHNKLEAYEINCS